MQKSLAAPIFKIKRKSEQFVKTYAIDWKFLKAERRHEYERMN